MSIEPKVTEAEVEIRQYGHSSTSTQAFTFERGGATLSEVRAFVAELSQICHWKEYRIGVGEMWTKWISPIKTN